MTGQLYRRPHRKQSCWLTACTLDVKLTKPLLQALLSRREKPEVIEAGPVPKLALSALGKPPTAAQLKQNSMQRQVGMSLLTSYVAGAAAFRFWCCSCLQTKGWNGEWPGLLANMRQEPAVLMQPCLHTGHSFAKRVTGQPAQQRQQHACVRACSGWRHGAGMHPGSSTPLLTGGPVQPFVRLSSTNACHRHIVVWQPGLAVLEHRL